MVTIFAVPITEAYVSTIITRDTTTVDDDSKDDESQNRNNFNDAEDKFNCIASQSENSYDVDGYDAPSPYPFTPKNWTMINVTRKTAIQMPMLYSCQ